MAGDEKGIDVIATSALDPITDKNQNGKPDYLESNEGQAASNTNNNTVNQKTPDEPDWKNKIQDFINMIKEIFTQVFGGAVNKTAGTQFSDDEKTKLRDKYVNDPAQLQVAVEKGLDNYINTHSYEEFQNLQKGDAQGKNKYKDLVVVLATQDNREVIVPVQAFYNDMSVDQKAKFDKAFTEKFGDITKEDYQAKQQAIKDNNVQASVVSSKSDLVQDMAEGAEKDDIDPVKAKKEPFIKGGARGSGMWIGGGIGLLVGGPVGLAVGAGVGLAYDVVRHGTARVGGVIRDTVTLPFRALRGVGEGIVQGTKGLFGIGKGNGKDQDGPSNDISGEEITVATNLEQEINKAAGPDRASAIALQNNKEVQDVTKLMAKDGDILNKLDKEAVGLYIEGKLTLDNLDKSDRKFAKELKEAVDLIVASDKTVTATDANMVANKKKEVATAVLGG